MTIKNTEALALYEAFQRRIEAAPEGSMEDEKRLRRLIGETCDRLIREVRALGFAADTCDGVMNVELAIFEWVRESERARALAAASAVAAGPGLPHA